MIYCMHRPSSLWMCDVTDLLDNEKREAVEIEVQHTCFTPQLYTAHSARWSLYDSDTIVFLGREDRLATHGGCAQLFRLQPSTLSCVALLDVVTNASGDDFPGIFANSLPKNVFISPIEIVMTTQWRSRMAIIKVSINSQADRTSSRVEEVCSLASILKDSALEGAVEGEWNPSKWASNSVIDVCGRNMLFSASSPNIPERLGIYSFDSHSISSCALSSDRIESITSKQNVGTSDDARSVTAQLKSMRWKIIDLQGPDDDARGAGLAFQGILIMPPPSPSGALPRLIVVPHGGPHSCMPTSFVPAYAFLALYTGSVVLHCNYRGSVGFGQDSIDSLPGVIGDNDVRDVLATTRAVLDMSPKVVDGTKVGIVGGSHGGFLSGHMVGQYPDLFKVAAMRNPVTNIPGMLTVTDIPDWCFVESLGVDSYDFSKFDIPTDAQLLQMKACSPVAHVNKVVAPTLICLGAKDRRVPHSQGIEFFHLLRSRGITTKLVSFPEDEHAIDKPMSEGNHWFSIVCWIDQHMPA